MVHWTWPLSIQGWSSSDGWEMPVPPAPPSGLCHPRRVTQYPIRHNCLRVLKSFWSSGEMAEISFFFFPHLGCHLFQKETLLHLHSQELIHFWGIGTPSWLFPPPPPLETNMRFPAALIEQFFSRTVQNVQGPCYRRFTVKIYDNEEKIEIVLTLPIVHQIRVIYWASRDSVHFHIIQLDFPTFSSLLELLLSLFVF